MKITQYQKIIKLLKEAGDNGINSFDARVIALQLPARIFYLKKPPYNLKIITVNNKNGSVNYILQSEVKEEPKGFWDTSTGIARFIESKPKEYIQERFI